MDFMYFQVCAEGLAGQSESQLSLRNKKGTQASPGAVHKTCNGSHVGGKRNTKPSPLDVS